MTERLPPFSARAAAGSVHLRLLSTTDLHMHIAPWDYYADRPSDTVGLARTASLIRAARAEAANSLLVDNGDYLQGNPLGDYIAHERGLRTGDLHPMIAAMNRLGYDCGTLGNHDFNYGVPFLDTVNAGATFPIVCANLVRGLGSDPTRDRPYLPPWVILERTLTDGAGGRHRLRIGLIGVLPPQVMRWDAQHLEGRFAARDILATARAHVPELRAAGADIVVALCHSGIAATPEVEGMENAALHLAAVPGIDVLVTGHSHLVFPSPRFPAAPGIDPHRGLLHGKPACMAGLWGSDLGVIDLILTREAGGWRVAASEVAIRPIFARRASGIVPLVGSAADLIAAVAADHDATLAFVRRPVGETLAPLHSCFALVTDDASVQIVADAQIAYVSALLKGTEWEGLPVLSAVAPFKAGGRAGPDHYTDVPAGPIAIRNVADLYLYSNSLQAVLIDGAGLAEWLEMSAGIYRRIEPGRADQPLFDADIPTFNFDIIDGVSYRIDLSQPARYDAKGGLVNPSARRITGLSQDGRPIDPGARFVVATNSYRAGGGGNFPGCDGSGVILTAPDTNRDVLMRRLAAAGRIDPVADGNWSLAPIPGASALFLSSPRGRAHLGRVPGGRIEDAGDGPEGFARYRLVFGD